MTYSQRPRRLLGFRRSVAPVASAMIVALVCSGLVPSVHAGDRHAGPPYDAAVLSEIAEDVLRRASGAKPSPVPIAPDATTAAAAAESMMEGEGLELAPDSPFTHIAPAREGSTVPTSPGVAAPGKVKPDKAPAGYRSNSWRQGTKRSRAGPELLVGRPRPVVRARRRPAGAGGRRRRPRPCIRVRLRAADRSAGQRPGTAARRPRCPLARAPRRPSQGQAPRRISRRARDAARGRLAGRERAGAKAERGAGRGARTARKEGRHRSRDADPDCDQPLRGRYGGASAASSKPPVPCSESTIPSSSPIARWPRGRPSRRSPPSTSCCSSS